MLTHLLHKAQGAVPIPHGLQEAYSHSYLFCALCVCSCVHLEGPQWVRPADSFSRKQSTFPIWLAVFHMNDLDWAIDEWNEPQFWCEEERELLCQLPLYQQPGTVVPDCWDKFCCSQCLVLQLVIMSFLQNPFYFLSFLWACRVRKTQVEALITPAMMKLCPLHLQDPCQ